MSAPVAMIYLFMKVVGMNVMVTRWADRSCLSPGLIPGVLCSCAKGAVVACFPGGDPGVLCKILFIRGMNGSEICPR